MFHRIMRILQRYEYYTNKLSLLSIYSQCFEKGETCNMELYDNNPNEIVCFAKSSTTYVLRFSFWH